MTIRIGTRASQLALWQAYFIEKCLQEKGLKTQIVPIETKGDKILDRSLSKIGSKGLFTEELEQQLRENQIDIAVHSAKDVPSELPSDLELIAFTKREGAHDVLVSLNPDILLQKPIVVGTSSTRRVALLKAHYPHIQLVDMRGNLQTRFRKLEEGQCDALILAYAGVHRMGYDAYIRQHLPTHQFVPPVGQGSVAVQVHKGLDKAKKDLIRKACNDAQTEKCLLAERAFLRKMQGGCSVPVFGFAEIDSEKKMHFLGGISSLDGQNRIQENQVAPAKAVKELGKKMAQKILSLGGKEILEEIKKELSEKV